MAKAVNYGLLILIRETETALLNACADIRHIREALMKPWNPSDWTVVIMIIIAFQRGGAAKLAAALAQ